MLFPMGLCRRGGGRRTGPAVALAGFVLVAGWPFVSPAIATAASASPPSTPTTTSSLPALPAVPLSVTDGQSAQSLLSNAITLASLGIDTTALRAGVAAVQQQLERDAVTAQTMSAVAAQADQRAVEAQGAAEAAREGFESLDGAVKDAVVLLYTTGPTTLTVNPAAGDKLAYAIDYANSAITPNGVLAARQQDADAEHRALAVAKKAQQTADRASEKAGQALAAEQVERNRLVEELGSIGSASATEVAADHAALAAQAGNELLSTSSLQFTPKQAIPAPLSTTPVALTWAFAELGKPYVWAATGPNSFDCSGLTQYVWREAGVSIPRVAADQDAWSVPVPLSQLLPGDLVFYGRTDVHHVGIYIGDGLMINAPHTGDVVRVSSIWWSDLAGFGRVHAPGTPVPLHQPPTASKPALPEVVPTAGPVPSQTKPPKGWKPTPGSSTPFQVYPPAPPGPTTTSSTVTTSTTSTTTVPETTTTTSPTTDTTGSVTTTTASSTSGPPDGSGSP
jgi:cell wall-associated NlpC family hydrolase